MACRQPRPGYQGFVRRASGLFLGFLLIGAPLGAQVPITPGSGTEKKPTPRDPKASQPLIPEHTRRKLDTNAGSLFKANGEIDMDKYAERRRQAEERKERAGRYGEREMQDALDENGQERLFHRALSNQFSVDAPLASTPLTRESHRESRGERFQIVFTMAAPFTIAASFGVFSLLKTASSRETRLSAGETIGFFVVGFGLAGGIAYYDYMHTPVSTDQAARLLEEKMYATRSGASRFEWSTPLVDFRFRF